MIHAVQLIKGALNWTAIVRGRRTKRRKGKKGK